LSVVLSQQLWADPSTARHPVSTVRMFTYETTTHPYSQEKNALFFISFSVRLGTAAKGWQHWSEMSRKVPQSGWLGFPDRYSFFGEVSISGWTLISRMPKSHCPLGCLTIPNSTRTTRVERGL